ncbi:DUF1775 domain-containing protein [Streptomyces albireticuli]|uniref:YncI copper-binding domain-containing protein n=1 Tax=Streptomyces albireticuli TaxID=1940 RepID=A0A2A2D6T3_9ACTN|nr:DUF1775 domain-containing protein [Streptomyces albireticuli]MCD9195155.1 DUF1775 domain-containing protein [Streptomyces albireticuli]PAU47032.1 hypothetical protein CK936_20720 [Streptomyces albireticuli]
MTRTPRTRPGRRAHRTAAVLATVVGALLPLTGTASAHVRVFSEGATEGSPATLRFRVPSEKADTTTVRVDVTLPTGVTSTGVPPASGWTRTEIPASAGGAAHIVWTAAAGHELKPDRHRYFDVQVGPLPKKPSIAFDVAQTYSDGTVANWNQQPTGGKEPDFPAAVLVLDATAAKAGQARGDVTVRPTPTPTPTPTPNRTSAATATAIAAAGAGDEGPGVAPWLPWTVAGAAASAAGAMVVIRRKTKFCE